MSSDIKVSHEQKTYKVTSRKAVYRKDRHGWTYIQPSNPVHGPVKQLATYSSPDGFNTKVWGPCLWTFLHIISFNYPTCPTDEQKHHYYKFIKCLGHILPCKACRDNYEKNLKELGFSKKKHLHNRETLARFMYDLHSHINELVNGTFTVPYDTLRNNFELFRARCSNTKNKHNGCVSKRCKLQLNVIPSTPNSSVPSFNIDRSCLTYPSDWARSGPNRGPKIVPMDVLVDIPWITCQRKNSYYRLEYR